MGKHNCIHTHTHTHTAVQNAVSLVRGSSGLPPHYYLCLCFVVETKTVYCYKTKKKVKNRSSPRQHILSGCQVCDLSRHLSSA